jgi:hypothetical protein
MANRSLFFSMRWHANVMRDHAESAKAKQQKEHADKRDRGQNNKSSRGQTTVVSGQRVKSYTYVPCARFMHLAARSVDVQRRLGMAQAGQSRRLAWR